MASTERWTVQQYRAYQREAAKAARAAAAGSGPRRPAGSKGVRSAAPFATEPKKASARARVRGGRLSPEAQALLAEGDASEEQIHRTCADWVFAHEERYPVLQRLMHVPNGGARSKGEAGKLKAMGVRPGVSDWICPFPSPNRAYKGLAIELKSRTGTVSKDQRAFLDDAHAAGWLTGVARSFEDFLELMTHWLREKPVSRVDVALLQALAPAYAGGEASAREVCEKSGASFGELLLELARQGLSLPQVTALNTSEQVALWEAVLEQAAARKASSGRHGALGS